MFESEWLQRTVLWVGGVITAAIGWFAKRQLDRIDALEKNSIGRPEFIRALESIEKKAELMHGQNQTVLNRIDTRIDTLLLNATAKKED